jgi:hypothetical protein
MLLLDPLAVSKNSLLVLNMTSTSRLSYLRYISCIFKWSNDHNIFQKVENRLFQVVRNGFNIPGTPFEAMFSLPQTQTDSIEGNSLENPIHLQGIRVDHFRSFLRNVHLISVVRFVDTPSESVCVLMIKYFSIGQKPVVEFDEWVGVLHLATMWVFQEVGSLFLQNFLCSD